MKKTWFGGCSATVICMLALFLMVGTAETATAQQPEKTPLQKANDAKKAAQEEINKKDYDCDKIVGAIADADAAVKEIEDQIKNMPDPTTIRDAKQKRDAEAALKKANGELKQAQKAAAEARRCAHGLATADDIEKELNKMKEKVDKDSKLTEVEKRLLKGLIDEQIEAAKAAAAANPCSPPAVRDAVNDKLADQYETNEQEEDRRKRELIRKWFEDNFRIDVSGTGEDQRKQPRIEEDAKRKRRFSEHISLPPGSSPLTATATGTGLTTGTIANLSLYNPTDAPVTTTIGPFFIPSGGQYQPYIVPAVVTVTVRPHATANVPIEGYCADIFSAPVPSGTAMPPFEAWIQPGGNNLQPVAGNGWKPSGNSAALLPGTATPLGHTIDINKHPASAAPLLLDALNRIAEAYDNMKADGAISTPFSGNPEKEREAVIQQTFWIYAAELGGKPYTREHFRSNTVKQYEANSGQKFGSAPAATREKIDEGVTDFWGTFNAVGTEAKVLSVRP